MGELERHGRRRSPASWTRSTTSSVRGSCSTSAISARALPLAVTQGMPSATELPKKISENDSPTTAPMPRRRIACGACSRDEPQPKFALHEQHRRAGERRVRDGWRRAGRVELAAIVFEEVVLETVERDGFQEARRDDAVGVDVVAAHRQRGAADLADALNGHWPSPRARTPARRRLRRRSRPRPPSPGSSAACGRSGCPAGP